ncbi:endonuclease YncB(thermonuclease family) [Phyllobacterium myrsinacearum]|uniref:thermonuclease family protein n=1 Tax=Phyllobacterium myrsinacearum TaxID=28101 RepID=UPI00102937BE|nr:thermonuclease family protein [Phyllobacterium myrsinacearum]RZS76905.1 endonuclease YncB(thermonuclease family) [Phyllobacterium myrsinacearum]
MMVIAGKRLGIGVFMRIAALIGWRRHDPDILPSSPAGIGPALEAAPAAPQPHSGAVLPEPFPFPPDAAFETGDTWPSHGKRYRLYGVQSCIRGTRIIVSGNVKRDCGALNILMVQAIVKDTIPTCSVIRTIDEYNALVICQTRAGTRSYDLASLLIARGWGFAAIDETRKLIVPAYRMLEEAARQARAGLWAYSDLPHPLGILHPSKPEGGRP